MHIECFRKNFKRVFDKILSRTGRLKKFSKKLIMGECENIDFDGDLENMTKDEEISQTPKYFRENNKVSIFEKIQHFEIFRKYSVFEKFSQRLVIARKCFRKKFLYKNFEIIPKYVSL